MFCEPTVLANCQCQLLSVVVKLLCKSGGKEKVICPASWSTAHSCFVSMNL